MSVLDAFGKNERSGMGGRNKIPICDTTYTALQNGDGDQQHHSLNSHRSTNSNQVNPAQQQQQQQPPPSVAVAPQQPPLGARGGSGLVFDPNMFGDNTSAAGSVSNSPAQHQRQPQYVHNFHQEEFNHLQEQQVQQPLYSVGARDDPSCAVASVQHELECDDGDLTLDRYHQEQYNRSIAGNDNLNGNNNNRAAGFFSEHDRRALDEVTTTDDFMERFNAEAARQRSLMQSGQQQQQHQQQDRRGPNSSKVGATPAVAAGAPQLVPLCPGCFSKNVRQNQSISARQKARR